MCLLLGPTHFPSMQCFLEKSTIVSLGNIPMDKNPQDRISIRWQRRIIQGFSNIIRLVVFLKRNTHRLKKDLNYFFHFACFYYYAYDTNVRE